MQDLMVLFIDEGPSSNQLAEIALESHFHFPLKKVSGLREALYFLEEVSEDAFLVICHASTFKNSDQKERTEILAKGKTLLLLESNEGEGFDSFSQSEEEQALLKLLPSPLTTDKVIDCVAEIMSATDFDTKDSVVPSENLRKVKSIYLKRFSHRDYDLFLEISSGKTIQVATKANKDMKSVIEHYEKKDLSYFLLTPEDYEDFIEHTKELLKNSEDTVAPSQERVEVTFETLDLAFTVAQDQLKALNINRIHQDFVNRSLENTLGQLKKNKDLFQQLKELLINEDYVVNHSVLNIYFASYLLSKLNWSNEQSLRQMTYACFYHDFELQDNELARVTDIDEVGNVEQKALIKAHPTKAAKLIEQLPGLNQDAYKIVMDHHEKPDGSGFPQGLQANAIPPMSCVFILSHELVDFLIEKKFKTQYLATKFQEMEDIWSKGNFKRPFTCAREILLD